MPTLILTNKLHLLPLFIVQKIILDITGGGVTTYALQTYLQIMASSHGQKKLAPRLTQKGFEKRKIPKDIYAAILSNRKKLLSSGKKWNIEYCTLGESFGYTKQYFYLFHIIVSYAFFLPPSG